MMTTSNGNIFCIMGLLCGEFTGHQWFPLTKASNMKIWYIFDLCLNKQLSKQSRWWWLQMPSCLLWCHCNAIEAPDKKIIPCTGIDHQIIVVSTGRWGMGMWQESSIIGTRQSAVLHLMNNIFSPDWMGQTYQSSALTYSPELTTSLLMLAIWSHSRHTNLMHNILHAILYHDCCI